MKIVEKHVTSASLKNKKTSLFISIIFHTLLHVKILFLAKTRQKNIHIIFSVWPDKIQVWSHWSIIMIFLFHFVEMNFTLIRGHNSIRGLKVQLALAI